MDKFKIQGGRKLEGEVRISGAKNAALPAMAATLLTAEAVHLKNIPHVRDIITMAKLLAHMRCKVESPDIPPSEFIIRAESVSHAEAPYELVKTMRASVLTLGPLVARFGYARVSLPGGCSIGARPIDLHIQALEKLGATITVDHGYVEAKCQRLRGAEFRFPKITVTGTENILTAAVLAEGETILENCALEPEIPDLAELLIKMGAKIEGAGTPTIRVQGVERLHGATHTIIPDRIEAGTFLVAGAITGGELLLTHCEPEHLTAIIDKLRECGVEIKCEGKNGMRVRAAEKTRGRGRDHRGISRIRHRHAGAIHGPGHAGAGRLAHPRNDFRESLPARQRNGAHGRQHRDRRKYCGRHWPGAAQRRARHRFGSARQRRAGPGSARR